jgi:hypothetical protein
MFLIMTQDLLDNNFVLPENTGYNNLAIPFTYPPLAFYLIGVVQKIFGMPLELILLWLPAIVNVITLFGFIYLAKVFFGNSHLGIALAAGTYAFIPRSFIWFSMGGGITRGLGQLFFILMVACTYKVYTLTDNKTKYIFLSILFGAGVVLSHPATTVHTIIAVALLLTMLPNRKKNFVTSVWVVLGIGLLCLPWLTTILTHHGLVPLLNAIKTSDTGETFFTFIPFFLFASEPFLDIITIFSLIGMATQLSRKDYLLPIWVILAFIISPRGAPRAAIVPMALLASIGLKDIILSGLAQINQSAKPQSETSLLLSNAVRVFLFACLSYAALNISFQVFRLVQQQVTLDTRTAMEWVENNTPQESQFVILTGETTAMCDSIQEWFPTISARTSLTTAQGKEWIRGDQFVLEKKNYSDLQFCTMKKDESCIKEHLYGEDSDYLFLMKSIKSQYCVPITNPFPTDALQQSLLQSVEWSKVYENDDVLIFAQKP